MAAEFVSDDTGTSLLFTCAETDETPINLAGSTVKLHWREATGTIANKTMTIVDAAAGTCSYKFLAGDLYAPGMELEVEITDSSGFKITAPALVTFEVRKRIL
jgi:hypothetical protein